MSEFTHAELEAYLDESIDPARAAAIESAIKEDDDLKNRLSHINGRRDAGIHTLGEIWRRHQMGVPSREDLGSYLLEILDEDKTTYIDFRINILKCQVTIANLNDLTQQQKGSDESVDSRRKKYFRSSAGFFKSSSSGDEGQEDPK
ncbi:hypothetical protein OAF34_06395 [Pirellulaceae bacterium]|jgi:hypothetical protein|nr:hypothetical protein [Pirellulaceae bacterium]